MFSRRSSWEMFGQFRGRRREVSGDWWSRHSSLWRIVSGGWGWQASCGLSLHLHHPPQPRFLWPPHKEENWQIFDKYDPYPVGHWVCPRTSEVPIDYNNCNQDANSVHDEGEQEIFGYEGKDKGGRGQDLRDEKQEHNQREENADTQGHFLTSLSGQVEHEHTQETNKHRRQNQVHSVKESFSPYCYVKSNVCLSGLWTWKEEQIRSAMMISYYRLLILKEVSDWSWIEGRKFEIVRRRVACLCYCLKFSCGFTEGRKC